MGQAELNNLVRIGQLKTEPRSNSEVQRLLTLARIRLQDARQPQVSIEGRFTSAYNAAHATALAALRWHGFRSENRFTVFQCLVHTVGWPAHQWRILDVAHHKRNLAEYEGYIEVEEATVAELCDVAQSLIRDVTTMVGM
ncbi:MAG: hypothetical protein U1E84_12500 [Rhodoferax sp.]